MNGQQDDARTARGPRDWFAEFNGPAITRELVARGWVAHWEYPGFIGISTPTAPDLYFTLGDINEELGLQVMNEDGSQCEHAEDLTPESDYERQLYGQIETDAARIASLAIVRMRRYVDSRAHRDAPTETTPQLSPASKETPRRG